MINTVNNVRARPASGESQFSPGPGDQGFQGTQKWFGLTLDKSNVVLARAVACN